MTLNGCLAGLVAITAPVCVRDRQLVGRSSGRSPACWSCCRRDVLRPHAGRRSGGCHVGAPAQRRVRHAMRRFVRRSRSHRRPQRQQRPPCTRAGCSIGGGTDQLMDQSIGVAACGALRAGGRRPSAWLVLKATIGHPRFAGRGEAKGWTSASTATRRTTASCSPSRSRRTGRCQTKGIGPRLGRVRAARPSRGILRARRVGSAANGRASANGVSLAGDEQSALFPRSPTVCGQGHDAHRGQHQRRGLGHASRRR